MGVKGLDIFCGVNESDPRSNVHYLSSSEKKAWKKFRPVRDLNPWPLWYWYRRGHGFKSCTGLNFFFFRPYFHYCSSSAHYCKDHFHSRLYPPFKYMTHIFLAVYILWLQFLIKIFFSLIFVGTLMFCWLVIHLLLSHRCWGERKTHDFYLTFFPQFVYLTVKM